MISSVRFDQQMALLPSERLAFLSMTTLRWPFAGKIERGGEADRPGADNGDRMTGRLRAVLVGRAPVRERRFPDVGHLLVFEHPLVIYRNVEA